MDLKGNGTLKKPPPYGIQMYKGYKNVALTRKTANFVTHHPIAKDFREWLADTLIPDESYYATLARIHQLDPDQQKVQMQDEVMAVWLGIWNLMKGSAVDSFSNPEVLAVIPKLR